MEEIARRRLTCPYCGKESLEAVDYLYDVPYLGKVIISVMSCSSCGYKHRDMASLEAGEAMKLKLRVEGERELRYLVIKSASASMRIPEAGLEYIPGPYAQGYITTVEGLLYEFHEAASFLCATQGTGCGEVAWIERAIEGKERFTLILCDKDGKSMIYGEGVEKQGMDDECP